MSCECQTSQDLESGNLLPENLLWTEALSQVCAEGSSGMGCAVSSVSWWNDGDPSQTLEGAVDTVRLNHGASTALLPKPSFPPSFQEDGPEVFRVFPVSPEDFVPSQSSPCSLSASLLPASRDPCLPLQC